MKLHPAILLSSFIIRILMFRIKHRLNRSHLNWENGGIYNMFHVSRRGYCEEFFDNTPILSNTECNNSFYISYGIGFVRDDDKIEYLLESKKSGKCIS